MKEGAQVKLATPSLAGLSQHIGWALILALDETLHQERANRAHEWLNIFVGKWHAEGESYAAGQSKNDPRGAVEKWASDETVERLPGMFFVIPRWDAMIGANEFKGTGIIIHDPETGAYVTLSYENQGFIRDYVTRVDGDIWTFTGDTDRARVEFTDGGDTQRISWEWRKPDKAWLPLCDRVATRVE